MLNLLPLLLFVRSVSKKTFLMTHFTQINKGYKVTSFYFGSKVVCEKVIRTNTFWHTDTRTALQTVCFSCLSVGAASKICGTTGFRAAVCAILGPYCVFDRWCFSSFSLLWWAFLCKQSTVVYLSVACLHANTSAWVAYPHSFAVCSQILTWMKANSTVIIFEIHS